MSAVRRHPLLRTDVGRREWVDLVKGVAIVMIVAYHTTLFLNSIDIEAAGIGRLRLVLDAFPMPAFFLISGMFHSRVGSWSFADLWRRRLRQYLYLYVLWSVIRFVFYVVAPNVRSDGAGESASSPLALLLIFVWPISSYWFIYALFVFTIVVWLFRRAPRWVLPVVAGVLSVLASSGLLDVYNVGINRMSEYLLFFVLGALFHRTIYRAVEAAKPWTPPLLVAGFLLFALASAFVPGVGRIPGVALFGQLMAVAMGFTLASSLIRVRALGWLSYLGVRSLNIYLVHIFVIALVVVPFTFFPWLGTVLPGRGLLLIALLSAVVIVVSIVLTRYLTRVSWLFVYPFGRRGSSARARAGA